MAPPIIRKSTDLTGIFNNTTFEQVFTDARPLKANINLLSKFISHPLEDNTEIIDHKVFQLNSIEIPLLLTSVTYRDVFQQIKKAYLDNDLFTIQTRTDTYQNMAIEQMPYEESVDIQDGVTVIVRFSEIQFESPTVSYAPSSATDSSTVNSGKQQTKTTNDQKRTSILAGVL